MKYSLQKVLLAVVFFTQSVHANESCHEKLSAFLNQVKETNHGQTLRGNDPSDRIYSMWSQLRNLTTDRVKAIPKDELDFLVDYKSLQDRSFTLDEIQIFYNHINPIITELENDFSSRIQPIIDRVTDFQDLTPDEIVIVREIRTKIERLMNDQDFGSDMGAIMFLTGGLGSCEDLQRELKIRCRRFYSYDEFLGVYQRVLLDKQSLSREKMIQFFKFANQVSDMWLVKNPLIKIQQEETDAQTTLLKLILPVKEGKGFSPDYWPKFYQELKNATEKFWNGEYLSSDGRKIRIQIIVESKAKNDSKAVACNQSSTEGTKAELGGNMMTFGDNSHFALKEFNDGHAFAHEVGHLLGFQDHYYQYFDMEKCEAGWNMVSKDIMTCHPEAKISKSDLELIYRAYGTPDETSNLVWSKIYKIAKKLFNPID